MKHMSHLRGESATGGVNPKLHLSLNDMLVDDRFPALSEKHVSKFSARDSATLLSLFVRHLVNGYTDVSITQEKLLDLIYNPYISRFESMSSEQSVSCLLHLGLLLFKTATSFFFSPPGIARLIGAVKNGRKEVVTLIRRRQYHEMPLRELLQVRTLKTSPCRIEFHLREMIGASDAIECVDTTIGPVIKVLKKH
jgi:serine/threonine-protein kinase 19